MRILVTGAAGPLGRHVVERLVTDGHAVVGLVRRLGGVRLMGRLGATPVLGDPRNPAELARAMAQCDVVIHLAGYFDFWEPAAGVYEAVNVGTTRNALAAALVQKTPRIVVCSSALTIGEDEEGVADEFTPRRRRAWTALERSKLTAERLALRSRKRGLEVVVVNPALVVSPRDPGWVGRLFDRAVRGERPLVSQAPVGWVWVEDAADAVMRAALHGADGARYILSGETLPLGAMVERVAVRAGVRGPRSLSPHAAMAQAALATAVAMPLGKRPHLAMDEARFLARGFQVDGSLAMRELGFTYTPSSTYVPTVAREYVKLAAHLRA